MVRFHPPEIFNLNPCVLGRAAKVSDFQSGEAGSIPAGHFEQAADTRPQASGGAIANGPDEAIENSCGFRGDLTG